MDLVEVAEPRNNVPRKQLYIQAKKPFGNFMTARNRSQAPRAQGGRSSSRQPVQMATHRVQGSVGAMAKKRQPQGAAPRNLVNKITLTEHQRHIDFGTDQDYRASERFTTSKGSHNHNAGGGTTRPDSLNEHSALTQNVVPTDSSFRQTQYRKKHLSTQIGDFESATQPTLEQPSARSTLGQALRRQKDDGRAETMETNRLCHVTDRSTPTPSAFDASKTLDPRAGAQPRPLRTSQNPRRPCLRNRLDNTGPDTKLLHRIRTISPNKMPLPSSRPLHLQAQNASEMCKNIQQEICIESLPRSLYISSRKKQRNFEQLQNNYMRNKFDHVNFDHFLSSKLGKAYYMGLNAKTQQKAEADGEELRGDADDYIIPLAKKHNELTKLQAVKYWERRTKSNTIRASSVGKMPKKGPSLKPIAEGKPRNKDIITCQALFRQFKNSGQLNDPESSIPWPDLEKKKELKSYIKSVKEKNANSATANSFFYQFRRNEEILANDVAFQRKLRKQALAFRDRRVKERKLGCESEEELDQKSSMQLETEEQPRGETPDMNVAKMIQCSEDGALAAHGGVNNVEQNVQREPGENSVTQWGRQKTSSASYTLGARETLKVNKRLSLIKINSSQPNEGSTCNQSQQHSSQKTLNQPPKKRAWKVKLIALLQNIHDEMGIKGPVQLDVDSEDEDPRGKAPVDQRGANQENPAVTKCTRQQKAMVDNDLQWTQAISKYIEEAALADHPDEMLSVEEYLENIKLETKVAYQNFLSPKQILHLKNEMNAKSEFIFKIKGKNYKLWKPESIKYTKDMKEVLDKTT